MSKYQFIASKIPVMEIERQFVELLSINDMISRKMPLPSYASQMNVDLDYKFIYSCESEEVFDEIQIYNEKIMPYSYIEKYTEKSFISAIDWRYSEIRAEQLIHYLKSQVKIVGEIELWNTWMVDEFDDIEKIVTQVNELDISSIKYLFEKNEYTHPICLTIYP